MKVSKTDCILANTIAAGATAVIGGAIKLGFPYEVGVISIPPGCTPQTCDVSAPSPYPDDMRFEPKDTPSGLE